MARIYEDGAGLTYDATTATYVSVPFGFNGGVANVEGAMEPWDFTDEAGFLKAADNSMAGLMRDCGECHVGGGGMEYRPQNGESTAGVFDAKGPVNQSTRVPYRGTNDTAYTTFNYFIDIFDEDGDGDTTDVVHADYTKSGVLEMDCLACHLVGYSWEAAKAAKRAGQFDVSRVTGAGIGTAAYASTTAAERLANHSQADWGTSVNYTVPMVYGDTCIDYTAFKGYCVQGVEFAWKADFAFVGAVAGVPPTENCASCHQATHQVDWKKRGEENPALDVHSSLGCMGCHARKEPVVGDTGHLSDSDVLSAWTGKAKAPVLGHDPAKGFVGPWDNLANKVDNVDFKECNDCHSGTDLGSIGMAYGAPNPAGAHAAAGLSANILQTGKDGVANANHLDIIGCQSCHITKSGGETGGAFVDGTGPDHEGRLADHDSAFVGRTMEGNFGYNWTNDKKIHPGNFLTSFFLRDKNDNTYDVNNDGRNGGMDALLQTHIAKTLAMGGNGTYTEGVFADGVVGATEIQDMLDVYNAVDPIGATGQLFTSVNGGTIPFEGSKVLFSFLTVPFTMSHSIDDASKALGVNGCTDCHGATGANYAPTNGGIFNRVVEMSGDSNISWNFAQMTPMTKVNGMSQVSFSHPKLRDKWLVRSLPLVLHKGTPDGGSDGTHGIRDITAGESLYEETFMTLADKTDQPIVGTNLYMGPDSNPVGWPSGAGTTHGFWLKINVCDADGVSNCTTRTKVAKTASTSIDDLLLKLGTFATAHEFTITTADSDADVNTGAPTTGNDHFVITPDAGYTISIHPYSGAAGVQMAGKPTFGYGVLAGAFKADPVTPTCQDQALNGGFAELTGRADMLAYLNALGADADADGMTNGEECFGIGVVDATPLGLIGGVTPPGGNTPITLEQGDSVTVGGTALAGTTVNVSVFDIFSQEGDTPLVDAVADSSGVTFNTPGTYRVVLETLSVEGKLSYDTQYIVVTAPLDGVFTTATATDNLDGTFDLDVVVDNTTLGLYDSVLVNFDDGEPNLFYNSQATTFTKDVAGTAGDVKRVSVIFKNGIETVAVWSVDITL